MQNDMQSEKSMYELYIALHNQIPRMRKKFNQTQKHPIDYKKNFYITLRCTCEPAAAAHRAICILNTNWKRGNDISYKK